VQIPHLFRDIDASVNEGSFIAIVFIRRGRFKDDTKGPSKIGVMDGTGTMTEVVFWERQFEDWGPDAQNLVDTCPHLFEPFIAYFFKALKPVKANKPE
jgi:hypothetical protein